MLVFECNLTPGPGSCEILFCKVTLQVYLRIMEADPQNNQVAAQLRTTIHRLVKLLRRETRNDAQLSLTERATLGLLYNEGQLAPSDIARTEKVTTQSISQVINHLAELSYIERTPSDDDKR